MSVIWWWFAGFHPARAGNAETALEAAFAGDFEAAAPPPAEDLVCLDMAHLARGKVRAYGAHVVLAYVGRLMTHVNVKAA